MEVKVKPGKYVIAVSGGVDSMVLLDMLQRQSGLDLVVAHYDHGIRNDSAEDRELVQETAKKYGLPFVYEEGKLGSNASEAQAREVRYAFLMRAQKEHNADAIITAHHQDDLLETAILNMLRGTGRKGLTSLANREGLLRPMLDLSKADIKSYAKTHNINWREDPTNTDERITRNYIRHSILPRFSESDKQVLLGRISSAKQINQEIDDLLAKDLRKHGTSQNELDRAWFIRLPHKVSCEVMAAFLRGNGVADFDRRLIERLVAAAKTKPPGKQADVNAASVLKFGKDKIMLTKRSPHNPRT